MDEDNIKRIPAAKSFIDGLKKERYRRNNEDGNDSSSPTLSCGVCMQEYIGGSYISNMPCSHMFHYDCLNSWLHESNSCPICRYQVEPAETAE
ncbi:hypothetical protein MKW92_034399 [Papaver armeniacum]|nr:hypothetical protein MKW92_034399 [Papaver armeniacum]